MSMGTRARATGYRCVNAWPRVAGTVALVLLLTASFGVAVAEAAFSPAGAGQIQGTWTSAVNSYDTLPYDGLGLAGGCQIKVEPEGTHGVLRGSAEQVIEGPDGPMTRKGVDRFDVDWTYSDPHAVTSGPARQVSDVEGTIRWTATWALSKDGESHSKVNEELTATFKGTWYLDGDKAGTLEGKATGQGVMTQTFPEANVKPEVTPKTVNWTFVSGGPGAAPSGAGDPASAASGSQTEKPGAGGLSITQVLIGLAAAGLAILGIGVGLKRRPAAAGAASDSSETAPLPDALPTQLPAGGSESEAAGPGGVDEAPEEEPEEPVEPEEPEQTEDERKGERVVLELLYPVGHSPKVFTNGWVFDARCVLIDETGDEADFSECVEWSGSGEFEPAVGSRSRPSFASEGQNTIVLKCDVGDQSVSRTFAVDAVSPAGFASVGTQSHCPEDAHGCVGCPHTVIGPVTEGSPLVRVNGKPAARVGDNGVHAACCGPNTFVIEEGDPEVLIDGRPAARVGDSTRHCGGFGHLVSESRA